MLPPATSPAATSELVSRASLGDGVQRLEYRYGPLTAAPGQNLILLGPVTLEKPPYDGYVVRVKPNLVRVDGAVPPVDVVHMHHAVFLNLSKQDLTAPSLPERFYAFAEEKTIVEAPAGFGYPVRASDRWLLNYMLHNGTTRLETVWITYEIDYVAADSPRGRAMRAVRPAWLDVQNGKAYPVFDVKRGSGGRDRRFTYPDDVRDPYGGGRPLNEWTVDRDSVLVGTAGHLHPGGLWTDLDVVRGGARRQVFRSEARYFDPNGPVSWDMAMTRTPDSWRVAVKRGDKLRVSTTYETERASWYESMGIMLVWLADGSDGADPFGQAVATRGEPTHGHLPEAGNHGGEQAGLVDPRKLPDGQTLDNRVGIFDFVYTPGGLGLPGDLQRPPAVDPGGSLRFGNADATGQVYHTITACKPPCNRSTGISYPLANGGVDFDSGQLGYGPEGFTAAANRSEWNTPRNLEPGTYTYFCRVHPFMRGAFRVKGCPARVRISRRPVRLRRGRFLGPRVRCVSEGPRCDGVLTLRAGRRARTRARAPRRGRLRLVRLGSRRFSVPAGRTRTVRIRVARRRRGMVRRLGRRRLAAIAVPRGSACRFKTVRARIGLRKRRASGRSRGQRR